MITVQIQEGDKTTDFEMPRRKHDEVRLFLQGIVNHENEVKGLKTMLDKALDMLEEETEYTRQEINDKLEEK